MKTLRTVIAEDHQVFAEGLKVILSLSKEWRFEVVGEAATGKSLLQLLKKTDADLLFLDFNMPDGDGLETLPVLRNQFPNLRIIGLTMFDDSKIVKTAFKSGIDGYILKGNPIEEIYKAVDEVMQGYTYMGKGVMLTELPSNRSTKNKERSEFNDRFMQKYNLTTREIEILQLITQALSNKEIAKTLFISDQTVSVHRKNIMRKLGVSNTAALLKIAYENSLV